MCHVDVENAFRAVWYNRPQELDSLLKERRVKIDTVYTNGLTLMHDAIHCLRPDAVAVLLMHGCDASPKTFEKFFHGDFKIRRIMEALLWGKADMQSLYCFDSLADLHNPNDALEQLNATTVLMDAANDGYAYAVRWLVSHRRAQVNFQNASLTTALLCAIESKKNEVADALILYAGASPVSLKLQDYYVQYAKRFPNSTHDQRYAAVLQLQIGITSLHNRIKILCPK
jgi:ankyrin repeat protein